MNEWRDIGRGDRKDIIEGGDYVKAFIEERLIIYVEKPDEAIDSIIRSGEKDSYIGDRVIIIVQESIFTMVTSSRTFIGVR